jgi:hypothetical protein
MSNGLTTMEVFDPKVFTVGSGVWIVEKFKNPVCGVVTASSFVKLDVSHYAEDTGRIRTTRITLEKINKDFKVIPIKYVAPEVRCSGEGPNVHN